MGTDDGLILELLLQIDFSVCLITELEVLKKNSLPKSSVK